MTDVYRIGVAMSLRNGVSAGLRLIRHDLGGVMKAMDGATASTKRFGKAMTATGALGVAAGIGILDVYEKVIKKGDLMQQQLANMRAAGVRQGQIAQNSAAAFGASTSLFNVTPQHAASTLMELRALTGNSPEARAILRPVLRAEVGIESATGGKSGSNLVSALKALDVAGGMTRNGKLSTAALLSNLPYIAQAMIQTRGMLTGSEIKRMIQQAGPAASSTSFRNLIMDSTEAVMGLGPAAGRGMYLMYKMLSAGQANALQAQTMVKLGLIPASAVHKIKGSFYRILNTDQIYADSYLQRNGAIAWIHDKLLPKLASEGITSQKSVIQQVTRLFPGSTGARLGAFLVNNWPQISRSRHMIENGVANGHPYAAAMTTWTGAVSNFSKAFSGLITSLGLPAVKSAAAALNGVSNSVHHFTLWLSQHPGWAKTIDNGLLAVGAGLTGLGVVMGTAGVVALVSATGPLWALGGAVAGVATVIGLYNWKSIASGVAGALSAIGKAIQHLMHIVQSTASWLMHAGALPKNVHPQTYGNMLNPFLHRERFDFSPPPRSGGSSAVGVTPVTIVNWGDGSRAIKNGLSSGLSANQGGMTGFNGRLTPLGTPAFSA